MVTRATPKRRLGNLGEDLACRFIEKNGFLCVERNYLRRCGEIDIVAKKEGKLHFFEVKTISRGYGKSVIHETGDSFRPEDNVSPVKLERMKRIIQNYLLEKKIRDGSRWQFDVITVVLDKEEKIASIGLIEDIIIS